MASAQVLSNSATSSRKQEHLEAGKRRLEEFRKKKAAERARKAASTNQLYTADASLQEKQPSEFDHVRLIISDGAGSSEGVDTAVIEPYDVNTAVDSSLKIEPSTSNERVVDRRYPPFNDHNALSPDIFHVKSSQQPEEKIHDFATYPKDIRDIVKSDNQSSYYGMEEAWSKGNENLFKVTTDLNPASSHVRLTNIPPEKSDGVIPEKHTDYISKLPSTTTSTLHGDSMYSNNMTDYLLGHGKPMPFSDGFTYSMTSVNSEKQDRSSLSHKPTSENFSLDSKGSFNHVQQYTATIETNGSRRSRPSFLDSLNVPRVSSSSPFSNTEPEKAESFMSYSSKVQSKTLFPETEEVESFSKLSPSKKSASASSIASSLPANNGGGFLRQGIHENSIEKNQDFYLPKQDDDFAALEQHIEDLTQEKFSLQRALEASRALAESLAAENSSLTDSYNQQGSVVNQLKSDMEKLQEEIKSQLAELESFKMEYANAQLECNAADERAKLLASEVIGLEEKALRLRSNELKLERQLENSNAEIASCRKKISSLDKDRQDLQSTVDALKEEKKLLQHKLRKASGSGNSVDVIKSSNSRKDVSTSTEDLDTMGEISSNQGICDETASHLASDASNFLLLPESRQFNFEDFVNIPPDQMRMIENINALISELAMEKEELIRNFAAESLICSNLKDLNKELSRKLEVQTQRLELLTAQSMASENIPARLPDSRNIQDNTAYADEGDEVVERVLGWIMKLFPGGPSRRRTSKRL